MGHAAWAPQDQCTQAAQGRAANSPKALAGTPRETLKIKKKRKSFVTPTVKQSETSNNQKHQRSNQPKPSDRRMEANNKRSFYEDQVEKQLKSPRLGSPSPPTEPKPAMFPTISKQTTGPQNKLAQNHQGDKEKRQPQITQVTQQQQQQQQQNQPQLQPSQAQPQSRPQPNTQAQPQPQVQPSALRTTSSTLQPQPNQPKLKENSKDAVFLDISSESSSDSDNVGGKSTISNGTPSNGQAVDTGIKIERKKRPKIRKVDGKWVFPEVTREETSEARRFLKKHNMVPFMERYLPENPTSSDLLYIIVLLGFNSMKLSNELTDNDEDEEKNLMYIVGLLRKAMNKVFHTRSRIGSFNTVEDAVELIKKSSKILVLTGAGISTSLGIPDFRSVRGIYANLPELQLNDPQEVFDLDTFRQDPSIFYTVAHMILPPENQFTPLHSFVKLLNDKGKLLRNYTQNIDDMETNAGLPPDKIVQCHGSFRNATCQTCDFTCKGSIIAKYIKNQEIPVCKYCQKERKRRFEKNPDYYPQSYGVVKPNITFFGEDLPQRYYEHIEQDVADCDLLLCIGTSLKVAPVSNIVDRVSPNVPQILINKDMINHTEFDVSLLGYCDDVASYLCQKLGWKIEHENFDKIVNAGLEIETIDDGMGIFQIRGKWKNLNEMDNKTPPSGMREA